MGKYTYILFDLDGTLTESAEGIVNSVLYSLKKNGIKEQDREKLLEFVGPPLKDSLEKYYGITEERMAPFIDAFHEYFRERGWKENRVYEGIPQALAKLKEGGCRRVLATSKPEIFAKQIMDYFDLAKYFDFIGGSSMDGTVSSKGEVISYVLDQIGRGHLEEMVMVGDREHDVKGARENGLPCIGVLYGYGTRAELERAGAAAICPGVDRLPEYLL